METILSKSSVNNGLNQVNKNTQSLKSAIQSIVEALCFVAIVITLFILLDIIFNNAKTLISIAFVLTGGYNA